MCGHPLLGLASPTRIEWGMAVSKRAKVMSQAAPAGDVLPVKTLKEHVMALDAAMLVAESAAEVGAVHKLRTNTRRVEAYLRLVDLLEHDTRPEQIPEHSKETKAVQGRLRQVRRAAGTVRDLDVQADAIWYDTPAKTAAKDDTIAAVRKEAKALRKHLQHTRKVEAEKLIAVLHREKQKLAAALRALEQVMKPASVPGIAPEEMGGRVQAWFASEIRKLLTPSGKGRKAKLSLQNRVAQLDEDALHDLRKAAKLCRYMAESAPDGSPVRAVAEQFEVVQEAGGTWHDWLLLARLSHGFHGKHAALTLRYTQKRDQTLREYYSKLDELLPILAHITAV